MKKIFALIMFSSLLVSGIIKNDYEKEEDIKKFKKMSKQEYIKDYTEELRKILPLKIDNISTFQTIINTENEIISYTTRNYNNDEKLKSIMNNQTMKEKFMKVDFKHHCKTFCEDDIAKIGIYEKNIKFITVIQNEENKKIDFIYEIAKEDCEQYKK